MAFSIPNLADAGFPAQAQVDKVDVDILVAAHNGNRVISDCVVTAQGSPDMTVAVASGSVLVNSVTVVVGSGNVTVTAADGTNPRFDLIVVNDSGTKSCTAGTPAASPVFPSIPANSVVLAAVYVPANDTDIDANQIIDKRVIGAAASSGGDPVNLEDSVDTPPTSPNADDDEFDDGSFDTGLWTDLNNSGPVFTKTEATGIKALRLTSNENADLMRGIYQSFTGNAKYRVKVRTQPPAWNSILNVGVFMGKNTTEEQRTAVYWGDTPQVRTIVHSAPGSGAGGSGNTFSLANAPAGHFVYLEIEWDGTTIVTRFSLTGDDGSFLQMDTNTPSYTPTIAGICMTNRTGLSRSVTIESFRRLV